MTIASGFAAPSVPTAPRTLKTAISCVGVGLHSGRRANLALIPAAIGTGIVFRRTDLGLDIPARFDHVVDTRLCTVIGLPNVPAARVGTVEHLMAALSGAGITDLRVEIDGPEIPILDGSADGFAFLIDCAGIVEAEAPLGWIEVLRPVRVAQGEAFAELRPANASAAIGLEAAFSIAFDAAAIGRQALSLRITPHSFRSELARARTFTQMHEIAALRAGGLALGGSLDNAVVVEGARIHNPAGLRMADEFVRHKLLDAVGDLALAGAPLHGRLIAHRGGHALNNALLRALFAEDANWRLTTSAAPAGGHIAQPGWQPQQHAIAAQRA
jgi:UDP-3-O-[3-hydroxymyristoyl] N-acetylglucosamine deacetylase